ncbi:MAG TPA: condensation domain-containing protein, partial [Thermoanaerobaculia bacterium]|nr:condensation domain-containing protein [Thermoanaerobaculia bacterium]
MVEPESIVDSLVEDGVFVFPASYAQERLWFLANLEPGSSAYNCSRALRLSGPLRLDLLRIAVRVIAERHETLRTCFGTAGKETVQIVHPSCPPPFAVVDLSRLEAADRARESLRLARREALRPFDLRQAPLIRVYALRLGAGDTVLLFTLHHIVTDGWSMNVLIREVSALYEALSQGRPAALPDLPIQYADYAVWQRERYGRRDMAEHLAYWRRHLEGAPQALDLPVDHPRSPDEGLQDVVTPRKTTSEESFLAFLKLVQRQEATAFMGLFAAFQVLILRWTGQEDFLVATPVSGRDLIETEGLIGFFVNMLALRARPVPKLGFRQLLAQVRTEVIDAFAHQDAPFTKVIEAVRPDRGWGGSLFQVLFTLEQDREKAPAFSGLGIQNLGARAAAAKFDLSVAALRDLGEFWIDYRADLFERPTIQRLADRFPAVIAAVVADPDAPLESLALLAAAERHQLLVEWNDVATEYPRAFSLYELFAAQAARRPDSVAVIWRGRNLTFGELDRRSGQLADRLRELGVGPEVPVALYMERGPEVVIGLLGILKAGGFYVPLDPSYPERRLADMLEDSGARVILTDRRLSGALPDTGAERIHLDGSWRDGEPALPRVTPGGSGPAGTAYVMYTSGSTGRPKGVRVPHRGVVRLVK